jgi:hypothetical protein
MLVTLLASTGLGGASLLRRILVVSCEVQPRVGGHEAGEAAPAACDQDFVASGSTFHPIAKAITERIGIDLDLGSSGARGTRTPDLSAASRTLSQLSYSPELVVSCKVNAGPLCVPWSVNTQMKLPLSRYHVNWNQERPIQIPAVHRDCVNLVTGITRYDVATRRVPRSADPDTYDTELALIGAPLALNSKQAISDVEREVVAPVLGDRLEYVDSQPNHLEGDRRLSDVALVVGGEHLRRLVLET